MHISELTDEQKMEFCDKMAMCGCDEELSSAYSNCLDYLNIEEPGDSGFCYTDGTGGMLFDKARDVMQGSMSVHLAFAATYDPDNFNELGSGNKGYEHAINMLDELSSVDSEDDFYDFLDSIDWD